LYRECLRRAKYVGHKQHNTALVVQMVRQQFRKNMHETDPEKIQKHLDEFEVTLVSFMEGRRWVFCGDGEPTNEGCGFSLVVEGWVYGVGLMAGVEKWRGWKEMGRRYVDGEWRLGWLWGGVGSRR
ncbi:complex 1 LYR domain-containing protein, partial [Tanacetum coccineum]